MLLWKDCSVVSKWEGMADMVGSGLRNHSWFYHLSAHPLGLQTLSHTHFPWHTARVYLSSCSLLPLWSTAAAMIFWKYKSCHVISFLSVLQVSLTIQIYNLYHGCKGHLSNSMPHCSSSSPHGLPQSQSQFRSPGLAVASGWDTCPPSIILLLLHSPLSSNLTLSERDYLTPQSKKQPNALSMHADWLSLYHLLHFTL